MEDDDDHPPPLTAADLFFAEEDGKRSEIEEQEAESYNGIHHSQALECLEYNHYMFHVLLDGGRDDVEAAAQRAFETILSQARDEETQFLVALRMKKINEHYMDEYKALNMDQEDEYQSILEQAAKNLAEVRAFEHESQCSCVIQRMYRRNMARRKLYMLRQQFKQVVVFQQFARWHLAQRLRMKIEDDLQHTLLLLIEEQELRASIAQEREQEGRPLLRDFNDMYAVLEKIDWERRKKAQDRLARATLEEEEAAARLPLEQEWEEGFAQISLASEAGIQEILDKELQRKQQEEYERRMEQLKVQHAQQWRAMEALEESVRQELLMAEDKDWWTIVTMEPAARSKALREHIENMIAQNKAEQDKMTEEYLQGKPPIEQEEEEARLPIAKLQERELVKALERQALREDIERIRVEEEYMYIRQSFIEVQEEQDWAALDQIGEQLLKQFAAEEAKRNAEQTRAAQEEFLAEEETEREALYRQQTSARGRMYRDFTRSFLRMPYQEFLELQCIDRDPGPFKSPRAASCRKEGTMDATIRDMIGFGPARSVKVEKKTPFPPSPASSTASQADEPGRWTPQPPTPPKESRGRPQKAAKRSTAASPKTSPPKKADTGPLPRVDMKSNRLSYRERVLMTMFGLSDVNGPLDPDLDAVGDVKSRTKSSKVGPRLSRTGDPLHANPLAR
jgi:hypothetical protein